MEAPEKIYLAFNVFGDIIKDQWQFHRLRNDDIEYVRKDTFVEKAANYLNYILYDRVEIKKHGTIIPSLLTKGEFIRDFKKYMEE